MAPQISIKTFFCPSYDGGWVAAMWLVDGKSGFPASWTGAANHFCLIPTCWGSFVVAYSFTEWVKQELSQPSAFLQLLNPKRSLEDSPSLNRCWPCAPARQGVIFFFCWQMQMRKLHHARLFPRPHASRGNKKYLKWNDIGQFGQANVFHVANVEGQWCAANAANLIVTNWWLSQSPSLFYLQICLNTHRQIK